MPSTHQKSDNVSVRSFIFGNACVSSPLVLALAYLFFGFKIHAAYLTSLLAELRGIVIILTRQCTYATLSGVIWDILWSCLVTILLVHGFPSISTSLTK